VSLISVPIRLQAIPESLRQLTHQLMRRAVAVPPQFHGRLAHALAGCATLSLPAVRLEENRCENPHQWPPPEHVRQAVAPGHGSFGRGVRRHRARFGSGLASCVAIRAPRVLGAVQRPCGNRGIRQQLSRNCTGFGMLIPGGAPLRDRAASVALQEREQPQRTPIRTATHRGRKGAGAAELLRTGNP